MAIILVIANSRVETQIFNPAFNDGTMVERRNHCGNMVQAMAHYVTVKYTSALPYITFTKHIYSLRTTTYSIVIMHEQKHQERWRSRNTPPKRARDKNENVRPDRTKERERQNRKIQILYTGRTTNALPEATEQAMAEAEGQGQATRRDGSFSSCARWLCMRHALYSVRARR